MRNEPIATPIEILEAEVITNIHRPYREDDCGEYNSLHPDELGHVYDDDFHRNDVAIVLQPVANENISQEENQDNPTNTNHNNNGDRHVHCLGIENNTNCVAESSGGWRTRKKRICMGICFLSCLIRGIVLVLVFCLPSKSSEELPLQASLPPDWRQIAVDILGASGDLNFGNSVSISSNGFIVAVGAPGHASHSVSPGKAKVYQYHHKEQKWTQLGDDLVGSQNYDRFGHAVSLSSDGNIVAVGAPYYGVVKSGNVHVFKYYPNDNSWHLMGQELTGKGRTAIFGYSVSLSDDGKTIAVGAPRYQTNGLVQVFSYGINDNIDRWVQKGQNLMGENSYDFAGYSISLSSDGNIVAIGAPSNDSMIVDTGHVRVYSFDTTNDNKDDHTPWKKIGNDIDGDFKEDRFGYYITLSSNGHTIAISAPYHNEKDYGLIQVYYYETTSDSWNKMGKSIQGDAENSDVLIGVSLSLSSDGKTLAIGSPKKNVDRGEVRVYKYNEPLWEQVGSSIDGKHSSDFLGQSVSLSSDGTLLSIGAPYTPIDDIPVGRIRVYNIRTKF